MNNLKGLKETMTQRQLMGITRKRQSSHFKNHLMRIKTWNIRIMINGHTYKKRDRERQQETILDIFLGRGLEVCRHTS